MFLIPVVGSNEYTQKLGGLATERRMSRVGIVRREQGIEEGGSY